MFVYYKRIISSFSNSSPILIVPQKYTLTKELVFCFLRAQQDTLRVNKVKLQSVEDTLGEMEKPVSISKKREKKWTPHLLCRREAPASECCHGSPLTLRIFTKGHFGLKRTIQTTWTRLYEMLDKLTFSCVFCRLTTFPLVNSNRFVCSKRVALRKKVESCLH